jgi:hypothetical protein
MASARFSLSRRVTVPSAIHAQAIALIMPGVFHVVVRIARSIRAIQGLGALKNPTRSPVATLLDRPDTYTVRSGASAASGGGGVSAKKAYAASSI